MRLRFLSTVFFLAGLSCLLSAPRQLSARPDEKADKDANSVMMEIDALRTLHSLELKDSQLKNLAKMAADTAGKIGKRKAAKASDKYLKLLVELRDAYAKNDEDKLNEGEEKLGMLNDTETPELDDAVEMTDASREKAPELLKMLTVAQVANYVTNHTEDFADPYEKILDGFTEGRTLKAEEWNETRDEIADTVGNLVGGIDSEKANKVTEDVKALLDKANKLTEANYKKQAEKLRMDARAIVGDLGPTEILKNSLEHALATMLSNPRLPAAVDGRIKNPKPAS
jgi:hypothetical protein